MMKYRYTFLWDVSWKGSLGKWNHFRCGIRNQRGEIFNQRRQWNKGSESRRHLRWSQVKFTITRCELQATV